MYFSVGAVLSTFNKFLFKTENYVAQTNWVKKWHQQRIIQENRFFLLILVGPIFCRFIFAFFMIFTSKRSMAFFSISENLKLF